MNLFGRLRKLINRFDQRRCAPKFAQRLGPRLLRDYGASTFYSAPQIRTACTKCRLPYRHLALAYAVFLPEAVFETTAKPASHATYKELRALFFRFTPRGEDFSVAPAPVNAYVAQVLGHPTGTGGDHLP